MYYSFIKQYYLMGLYTDVDLDLFVSVAWISEEQKAEIVVSKVA
ncbi:XkdX family protein [Clostridium neonatale]